MMSTIGLAAFFSVAETAEDINHGYGNLVFIGVFFWR